MSIKKSEIKQYLAIFNKLTDSRFNFNICSSYNQLLDTHYEVNMHFMDEYTCSSSFDHNEMCHSNAFECLVDLIVYAEKRTNEAYFNRFGVAFEIYHNKLNGNDYFKFRKNECDKWVNISYNLAEAIIGSEYAEGLCDNVVSYREYDCYYQVNIKV